MLWDTLRGPAIKKLGDTSRQSNSTKTSWMFTIFLQYPSPRCLVFGLTKEFRCKHSNKAETLQVRPAQKCLGSLNKIDLFAIKRGSSER